MGLIALYWFKLYKPLIDTFSMKQGSSGNLGFIKAAGWETLANYNRDHPNAYTQADYLQALRWENPERSTARVRSRVAALQHVDCCWSGTKLSKRAYAVDHTFPFARWPNNDLWNLLPTKTTINSAKSDKLPTRQRLVLSRDYIIDWWQQAWHEHDREFFTQAMFALPDLTLGHMSFDDVFEAMLV